MTSKTTAPTALQVLYVENNRLWADSVVNALKPYPEFAVSLAQTPEAARAQIAQREPDLVLLDLDIGEPTNIEYGLGLLAELASEHPTISIVIYSGANFISQQTVAAAVAANASYVDKSVADLNGAEIAFVLRITRRGGRTYSPAVAPHFRSFMVGSKHILRDRLLDVAAGIHRGWTNRQIGDHLGLSENTVRGYVGEIMQILSMGARAEISAWYEKHYPNGHTP